jgi:DNA polymerase III sliding clamp (beta) subunit (PCNA family)
VRFAATDSYSLSVETTDGPSFGANYEEVLVPARLVRQLGQVVAKLGADATVSVNRTDDTVFAWVSAPGWSVELSGRLVEGDFPNWGGLIPNVADMPLTLDVDRELWQRAAEQAATFAGEREPVRINTDDTGMSFYTLNDGGRWDGSVTAVASDAWVDFGGVGFNPSYLANMLAAAPGDKVRLSGFDSIKPWAMTVDGSNWLGLLCPIRFQ